MNKQDTLPPDARPNDPTPAQIHEFCLNFQTSWTDGERYRRTVMRTSNVDIQVIADRAFGASSDRTPSP